MSALMSPSSVQCVVPMGVGLGLAIESISDELFKSMVLPVLSNIRSSAAR